jgi:plastocyanin
MLDLDQRIATGLRSLADRAPTDVDVWLATERRVTSRHRRRRATVGGLVVIVALVVVTASIVGVRGTAGNTVATPGPGAEPRVLAADGPIDGSFTVRATNTIRFEPAAINVSTGIYAVTLENEGPGQHTLNFDDPETLFSPIEVARRSETKTTRIFFGRPGDYVFSCAIPGHRLAGEVGAVHVTGPPITLSEAEGRAAGASARE